MSDTPVLSIAQRREALLKELADAASPPPRLIAVSKRQPEDRIEEALAGGQRIFGENQVQEAQKRWAHRRGDYPDLELHLVGALQTNKSEDAVALFDVIHSLDRPKLARTLARAMEKLGRSPKLLIQVNTGEEPQKAGVIPDELDDLLAAARDEGLSISGLMCIPPAGEPAAPHFALLARLAHERCLSEISMGMSGDYALAARLGATMVRVGTAVFGPRPDAPVT
ncbi:MAG: YggS family pyridoxal phosphate-dependent enzyme [Pseudomonadota bacterium]